MISPLLAVLCWYAKGTGIAAWILDVGIFAVFTTACFAVGFIYVDSRGLLYLLTFACAVIVLYRNPKQITLTVLIGFLISFLIAPYWPFQ